MVLFRRKRLLLLHLFFFDVGGAAVLTLKILCRLHGKNSALVPVLPLCLPRLTRIRIEEGARLSLFPRSV